MEGRSGWPLLCGGQPDRAGVLDGGRIHHGVLSPCCYWVHGDEVVRNLFSILGTYMDDDDDDECAFSY